MSCVIVLLLAPVIALAPALMCPLLTGTPSITYSAEASELIDVTPRIWICIPPPGAPPLFCWMIAPGNLPLHRVFERRCRHLIDLVGVEHRDRVRRVPRRDRGRCTRHDLLPRVRARP